MGAESSKLFKKLQADYDKDPLKADKTIEQIFHHFDKDKSGLLQDEEVEEFVSKFIKSSFDAEHFKHEDYAAASKEVISIIDTNKDGCFSLQELKEGLAKLLKLVHSSSASFPTRSSKDIEKLSKIVANYDFATLVCNEDDEENTVEDKRYFLKLKELLTSDQIESQILPKLGDANCGEEYFGVKGAILYQVYISIAKIPVKSLFEISKSVETVTSNSIARAFLNVYKHVKNFYHEKNLVHGNIHEKNLIGSSYDKLTLAFPRFSLSSKQPKLADLAPEKRIIVEDNVTLSLESDLYSLGVLLFKFAIIHHPAYWNVSFSSVRDKLQNILEHQLKLNHIITRTILQLTDYDCKKRSTQLVETELTDLSQKSFHFLIFSTGFSGKTLFCKQLQSLSNTIGELLLVEYTSLVFETASQIIIDLIKCIIAFEQGVNKNSSFNAILQFLFEGNTLLITMAKSLLSEEKTKELSTVAEGNSSLQNSYIEMYATHFPLLLHCYKSEKFASYASQFKLQCPQSCCFDYFSKRIEDLVPEIEKVSEEDLVRTRVKTIAIVPQIIPFGNEFELELTEIGGLRANRKKAAHYIQDSSIPLYIISTDDLGRMCYEDDSTPRLVESLNLVQVWLKRFSSSPIIVIINIHSDFCERLKKVGFKLEFPQEEFAFLKQDMSKREMVIKGAHVIHEKFIQAIGKDHCEKSPVICCAVNLSEREEVKEMMQYTMKQLLILKEKCIIDYSLQVFNK